VVKKYDNIIFEGFVEEMKEVIWNWPTTNKKITMLTEKTGKGVTPAARMSAIIQWSSALPVPFTVFVTSAKIVPTLKSIFSKILLLFLFPKGF
jgi:hypothetical protein